MKIIITVFGTLVLLLTAGNRAFAQDPKPAFSDNNPVLTAVESEWLNEHLPAEKFDFRGKTIGFYPAGFIPRNWLPTPWKKGVLSMRPVRLHHRLFPLNDSQKQASHGFDALLFYGTEKDHRRLAKIKPARVIPLAFNRYPIIPPDAGKDADAQLSEANAVFLNRLYQARMLPDSTIDFRGKKVAIFQITWSPRGSIPIGIPQYFQRLQGLLDTWGHPLTDFTYPLTPEQKAKTGGYDVIIVQQDKKGWPLQYFVDQLAKEAGN